MIARHDPRLTATSKPAADPEYRMRACRRCGRVRPARVETLYCEDCVEVMAHEDEPESLFDDGVLDELWSRGDGE